MAYIDEVTADAPVVSFRFNGTAAKTGTGVASGAPSSYTAGIGGQAAVFTGAQTVFASSGTTNAYGSQPTSITMECWVRTESTSDGVLLRVAGGVGGTMGSTYTYRLGMLEDGRAYFRFEYQNLQVASHAAINDGEWHHVVGVGVYNQVRVFVDGVKATATTTNYGGGIASPKFYVGSAGDSMYFDGVIDEAATYNKALTDARITAHYDAGLSEVPGAPVSVDTSLSAAAISLNSTDVPVETTFNTTLDVDTPSTSLATSDVSVGFPRTTDVLPATVSVSTKDVSVDTEYVYSPALTPTSDYVLNVGPEVQDTNTMVFNLDSDVGIFTFDLPVDVTNTGLKGVDFTYSINSSSGAVVALKAITAPLTDPLNPVLGAASVPVTSGYGTHTYDVSSLIEDTNTFYGIAMVVSGQSIFFDVYSMEDPNPANRPVLTVHYTADPATNVDLAPASMTLATSDVVNEFSHDSVVDAAQSTVFVSEASVDTNSVLALDAAAINAEAPLPTVEAVLTPDAIAELDAAVVLFAGTNSTASIPVEIDVDVATLSVTSPDANIQVRYNAIAVLDAPKILVYRNELESVNGDPIVADENDDAYFNAVMLNEPSVWYRFNDQTNPVKPRVPLNGDSAHISNAVMGLNDGPNGRRYVHFNGTAMFTQPGEPFWSDNDENYAANGTLEFSIRTSKRNQFIMRMDDAQAGILFGVDTGPRDLYLKDGRLELRQYGVVLRPNVATPDVLFTGMADIADDRWHHIVLTYEDDRQGDRYSVGRVNLYIDGELDIRKYKTSGFGFPDWIGGRPSYPSTWSAYFDLPQTQWFVGDIAEVAYYNNNYFQLDTVTRHYDTLIGRDPVYLEAAKVEFESPDAIIKGNKTRVLVLDFGGGIGGGSGAIYQRNGKPIEKDEFAGDYKTGYNSFSFDGYGKWIRDPNYGISGQRVGRQRAWDNDGMLIYNISVTEDYDTSGSYVNERLDTPRLLDLDVDLNMADYDVISIVDFPQGALGPEYAMMDEGVEFGAPTATQQFERLIEQVRKQVVAGKGLMLADPASAIALGIIDRAEYVPSYIESTSLDQRLGAVTGFYDAFGENGKRGPASTEISHIARYRDQHANMFQRVRTAVPGLTDRKGFWIQTDTSLWRNVDPFATPNARYKYRHEDRTETGLLLDDEFYLRGNGDINPVESFWDSIGSGTPRNNGWVATPIANIKSGVAVTSFAPKVGMKDEMVDNPYKEYAVSIAVRPGDSLKGETIAGKVYVNFTEAYVNWASTVDLMPREIIPEDGWDKNRRFYVPEEDRYWTYSETRGNWVGDTIVFSAPIDNSNWDSLNSGEVTSAGKVGSSKKMYEWKWAMMNYMSAFEIEPVRVAPMSFRALLWLTEDIQQDGNAVAGLQPAKATAGAKDVTVSTTASTEVFVGTARTTMDILPMRDVTEPDTTALVGTPTVRVQAKEFMEVVDLDAARITLNAPETDNDRLASVDRIFVTLPVHKITLILEEE